MDFQSWGKKTIVSRHKDDKCQLGQRLTMILSDIEDKQNCIKKNKIALRRKKHRKGFSDTDIRKLNTLYNCKGYPQVSLYNHNKGIVSPSNGMSPKQIT